MPKAFIKCYKFCHAVYSQFMQDGCSNQAAALAFTSLLSLVPLMTVSFGILKAFPEFHALSDKIQNLIFENFVADSAQVAQQYLQEFSKQAMNLSAVGLVSLLVTAVLMIFSMEQTFNHIWRVKRERKGIPAFLMYWAVLTLLPILVGASIAFTVQISNMSLIATAKQFFIVKILLHFVPFIANFIAFTLLYSAVPNCKVPFRAAAFGGIFTAVLFEIAKRLFTWYIVSFPTYSLLYGALAAIPIFLVWVYVFWLILLFGAVIGHISVSEQVGIFDAKGCEQKQNN